MTPCGADVLLLGMAREKGATLVKKCAKHAPAETEPATLGLGPLRGSVMSCAPDMAQVLLTARCSGEPTPELLPPPKLLPPPEPPAAAARVQPASHRPKPPPTH